MNPLTVDVVPPCDPEMSSSPLPPPSLSSSSSSHVVTTPTTSTVTSTCLGKNKPRLIFSTTIPWFLFMVGFLFIAILSFSSLLSPPPPQYHHQQDQDQQQQQEPASPSSSSSSSSLLVSISSVNKTSTSSKVVSRGLLSSSDYTYPSIFPNQTKDLLDFAVVGFAKCGTTFLMRDVFGSSKNIYMGYSNKRGQYKEMHQLENMGQLPDFLSYFTPPTFDSSLVSNQNIRRGFKAPNTLMFDTSLIHLSLYFPTVKFIVSVRHPILWFQSNYNYKMRLSKYSSDTQITPFNRVGECKGGISNDFSCMMRHTCVSYKPGFGCTDLSNFHIHLSRLGWTPRNTTNELSLLQYRVEDLYPTTNTTTTTSRSSSSLLNFTQSSMFLIELNQLDPRKNSTKTDLLISDLESFLNLQPGSLPKIQPPKTTGTSKHVKKAKGNKQVLNRMISICNDEYKELRQILLKQGIDASTWIQDYFLTNSNHVFVSNKEYFIELLQKWKVDPCEEQKKQQQQQHISS